MTFNFIPVSEVYIDNVINKLKNKSSCSYDNISNKHIKYAKNVLTKPLTLLINQCLHTGIFPSQLKLSQVNPIQSGLFQTVNDPGGGGGFKYVCH